MESRGITVAAANGWLPWCARATCKALQSDKWAAWALRDKARDAAAWQRCRVKFLLKPDIAETLAHRLARVSGHTDCLPLAYWLRMLHCSFIDYAVSVRCFAPTPCGVVGAEAAFYMSQLKRARLSDSVIAKRTVPLLHVIAGHLKFCEGRIESIIDDQLNDGYAYLETETWEALSEVLADAEIFVLGIQDRIEPYVY